MTETRAPYTVTPGMTLLQVTQRGMFPSYYEGESQRFMDVGDIAHFELDDATALILQGKARRYDYQPRGLFQSREGK